jgi:hypothetical protein
VIRQYNGRLSVAPPPRIQIKAAEYPEKLRKK